MLGFDALSLPFLRAHLDELPTFKNLFAKGALIEPETTGNHFPRQLLANIFFRQRDWGARPIFSIPMGPEEFEASAHCRSGLAKRTFVRTVLVPHR